MEYLLHIIVLIEVYTILSVSLNLIAGYAGMISISHAAFYGIGAYVGALMALRLGSPLAANMLCAVFVSVAIAITVAIPSLRIRDDHFIIATFAFQIIAFSVFNNWISFTGGPMGLPGIPRPRVLGMQVSTHLGFSLLGGVFCVASFLVARRLSQSPFGRLLRAIREDTVFATASGKDVGRSRIIVFAIGSAMASMAGVLYAGYVTYIDPTMFTVGESIFIISIVIIGGAGSLWGPVVGTLVLVVAPEILRFVGLPNAVAANLRQVVYGGLLVGFMMWRPRGILGEYDFFTREN